MSVQPAKQSRREERRTQTSQEITTLAMEQVAAGGPDSVSLNAIARAMRMSPAALYRYFDSRDALLADLVVGAYDSYADALEVAARIDGTALERLVAVAHASRAWALAQPNAYRLIFQSTAGSGQDLAPERTIRAASRSMAVLLSTLASVGSPPSNTPQPTGEPGENGLMEQMARWADRIGATELPPRTLALAFRCWTRLHGVISLELGQHLASTGVDPAVLYAAEVDALIREAHQLQ